ncbi:hypothetical protein [uncultured Flavobacterium sp.]|uniref:hypothetical protein n=1 Tax=uncultured Flavobacterium sp. TaxID=165435 RepID=UPI00292E85FA|nr:hypothetical protein [uncultured Flavobacterium sp.]
MKRSIIISFIMASIICMAGTNVYAQKSKFKVEETNILHFHLVDFLGWNRNMDVLANYHAKDVKVYGDGWMTTDMHQHEQALAAMLTNPATSVKVEQHTPNVARGEWTGVVGVSISKNMKIATIAKWKGGLIVEEYLFIAQLPADCAASIQPSSKSIISFTSPNDKGLMLNVDVQPGWTCTMDTIDGKRTAFFIKKENGKEVERLVFQ